LAQIRAALAELNPWWKGSFTVDYRERELYPDVQRFMKYPQMIALTGLRRVGKTTLMLKLVEDSIAQGFEPKSILYFSFDEFRETRTRRLLTEYETLTEGSLDSGRHLILLDEVQKLDDWENQLKAVYDRYRTKVKIVVSGSESLFIRKGSRETLAGRLFEFKVGPLSFREYLTFKNVTYKPVGLYERELARLFGEFVLTQGFPELVGVKDRQVIRKYLRDSIVEKVVFRDLPTVLKIRDVSLLESLLNILMEEPGQLVDVSKLAGEMNVSRQTLSSYLMYLEQAFLVRKLYNYSPSRRKVERKLRKYYPTVMSADLLFSSDDLSKSKVFECTIVNQLQAEFFWRDPYKNEVDVVLTNRRPLPIEIKYGRVDLGGLQAFARRFKIEKAYVVSDSNEETRKLNEKTVSVVPCYKFLLTA